MKGCMDGSDTCGLCRDDLYKDIEPDYYGFRDDEDEELAKEEQIVEAKLQQQAKDQWDAVDAARQAEIAALVRLAPCHAHRNRNSSSFCVRCLA